MSELNFERAAELTKIQEEVNNFKKSDTYKDYMSEVPKQTRPSYLPQTPIKSWKLCEENIETWKNQINHWKLFQAACLGNLESYEKIAIKFHNKNPENNDGLTPLHLAAQKGHLQICQYIAERITLSHKYIHKVNPKTYNGNTPLHFAAKKVACPAPPSLTPL